MSIKLESDKFQVSILEKGAELSSMMSKESGIEYIWTGDPSYWGRHAPILFPIIGRLRDDSYIVDGHFYKLNQHGFARDMIFTVKEKSKNQVLLRLSWNETTLNSYPYKFYLDVNYLLEESTLHISYIVKNCDEKSIYFSLGAHPGFNCPLEIGENLEDYYFEFEKNENSSINLLNSAGLIRRDKSPLLKDQKTLPITKDLFSNDALIFNNLVSSKVAIKNRRNSRNITVDFSGFPFLGLWSKPTGAPFICIEPWFGHADYCDFNGDFKEKEDIITLGENSEFRCNFSITIS